MESLPRLLYVKAMIRVSAPFALLLASLLLAGADSPSALAGVAAGEWSVSRFADGHDATRTCLPDLATLARWEHRQGHCRSGILLDRGNRQISEYRCDDSGFGRSEIEVLTPRTLRISTQGISSNFPFNYVLHARRLGDCRPPRSNGAR